MLPRSQVIKKQFWAYGGPGLNCGHFHDRVKDAVECAIIRFRETGEPLLEIIGVGGKSRHSKRIVKRMTLQELKDMRDNAAKHQADDELNQSIPG